MTEAEQFLFALTGSEDPSVSFQTFDDKEGRKDQKLVAVFHGKLKKFLSKLERLNADGAGIFVTINETNLKGRKKDNIVAVRALFIDKDDGALPTSFPIPPSIIVKTGHGWHVYWLLRAGEPRGEFEPALKRLIAFYGSDPKPSDLSRVLRLPGFLWRKEEPGRPVQLTEAHPERIYSIAEILAAHPLPEKVPANPPKNPPRRPPVVSRDHDISERMKRASAYLAKLPGAVSGSDGHGDAWKAALTVVRGFSLPPGVAFDLLASEYNPRCSPPWSDRELEHKVDSAFKDSTLPDGYLLDARNHTRHAERPPTEHRFPDFETPEEEEEEQQSTGIDAGDKYLTDNTIAKRFIGLHSQDLRYVETWKTWLLWKGGRWEFDQMRTVDVLARTLSKQLLLEAVDSGDGRETKTALEFQKRSRIEAVVALSRCDPRISRRPGDFDKDPWLFNCTNGTLDLRTGVLGPHQRQDHITKVSPVPYDPQALCPRWDKFLEEIFLDPLVRAYVKRAVGYSMTASVREQVLFFAHGGGANGKSVLLGAVSYILGQYGKTAAPELLVAKTNEKHETELADLAGVRLVTTIETESGRRLAESKTKMLTGGDRIKARFLYADFFEFDPTFKLWLVSNHKPNIRGTDEGIWRRIHLIPFTVRIPPEKQDVKLSESLREEAAGILRWAVEGCMEWQACGLHPPSAVLSAVKGYRDEMDTIGQFLEERCIIGTSLYASSKDLYAAYTLWCEENGEHAVTQKALGTSLQERGFEATILGNSRARNGLALRMRTSTPKSKEQHEASKPKGKEPSSDQKRRCEACGKPCNGWCCDDCASPSGGIS